jgi:hypothetical protein
MWLWMEVRAWHSISGCIVLVCSPCMVLEPWLICFEPGPFVVLEQYFVVAGRCPCVVFYQGMYSCGFWSVCGTKAVVVC